jgi:thiamine pyrophosphokinase
MADWKTRLAVSYVDEDKQKVDVTPITSFTPTFSLNAEALHSLEATHIGVIFSPQAMSFSMTVPAIGDAAGKLTALALKGKRFDVTLQEANGSDWSFKTVVMSQCVITNAQPSAASISGAPAATFSGFSLAASAELAAGGLNSIP